jgi:hypothetical protein
LKQFTLADAYRLRAALVAEAEAEAQRGDLKMRTSKPTVDRSKHDRERLATYARGGDAKMFKPQAAGPAKRGITGKAQSPAPGARAAKGGPKSKVPGRALSAKGGRTVVR